MTAAYASTAPLSRIPRFCRLLAFALLFSGGCPLLKRTSFAQDPSPVSVQVADEDGTDNSSVQGGIPVASAATAEVDGGVHLCRCFAQIGFKELIEAGLEERAKLEAYSFTYRSAHRVQDLFVVFEEGAIVGMPKKNLWYTKRKAEGAWLVQPANGQKISPDRLLGGDEVHTIHRNGTSYRAKRGRGISPTEAKTDTPLSGPTEPFDFRYFGLAYEGDISAGKTYEKIMETYRTFPDVKQTKLEFLTGEQDGCVEVHFVWNRLIVDLKKGHWPVSLKAMGSKLVLGEFVPKVNVQTDIELINKFDHWWPKRVVVTDATGDSREIFFEWKDPKTVEEAMFDPSFLVEIANAPITKPEPSGPENKGK